PALFVLRFYFRGRMGQADPARSKTVSKYVADFPLWYLSIPGQAKPKDILGGPMPAGGKFAPVFSDEDLAQRFVSSDARFKAVAVHRPELTDFLDQIEERGFTHVAIDPKPRTTAAYTVSVSDLRRAFSPDSEGQQQ